MSAGKMSWRQFYAELDKEKLDQKEWKCENDSSDRTKIPWRGIFYNVQFRFFSAEALKTGLQTVSYWVAAPPNLFTTSNFSPLAFFHLLQNMAI